MELCSNKVNIGDVVEIEFIYANGHSDIDKFKLTGNWKSRELKDYQEITLNSPLGKAIYNMKIGNTTTYKVNNKEITIKILKKL